MMVADFYLYHFFFNDTATTEIYTLSLHDALPISSLRPGCRLEACATIVARFIQAAPPRSARARPANRDDPRSEEHTSELQSPDHLVCRLLLEKKKTATICHTKLRRISPKLWSMLTVIDQS